MVASSYSFSALSWKYLDPPPLKRTTRPLYFRNIWTRYISEFHEIFGPWCWSKIWAGPGPNISGVQIRDSPPTLTPPHPLWVPPPPGERGMVRAVDNCRGAEEEVECGWRRERGRKDSGKQSMQPKTWEPQCISSYLAQTLLDKVKGQVWETVSGPSLFIQFLSIKMQRLRIETWVWLVISFI